MELFINYRALPQGVALEDVVSSLNEALDDQGTVCGGERATQGGRIDLELEDERANPKFAQMTVKAVLQRLQFPADTTVEIGGMEIQIYEG